VPIYTRDVAETLSDRDGLAIGLHAHGVAPMPIVWATYRCGEVADVQGWRTGDQGSPASPKAALHAHRKRRAWSQRAQKKRLRRRCALISSGRQTWSPNLRRQSKVTPIYPIVKYLR
jgi:hypothetical protein